jgi:hypothetical protein
LRHVEYRRLPAPSPIELDPIEDRGPIDWLWEIAEASTHEELAQLWPNPGRLIELLGLAKRENLRDALRLVLDGLQESPLLHDPALATTSCAIVALIKSTLRA